MAYTHVWRTTVPSKMVKVDALDDHIRRLRLEIQEHMTFDGVTWTADPITSTATRYHYLHWSEFKIHSEAQGTTTWPLTDFGLSFGGVKTQAFHGSVVLPRNATLTECHLSCATGANGTIPWALLYVDTTGAPAETVVSSGTIAANTGQGNQALFTGGTHVVDNTPTNYKYYSLRLTFTQTAGAGGPIIQGARFKYTVPNIITASV